jgi:hypothetical protein
MTIHWPPFPTPIHRNAQRRNQNFIDAKFRAQYRAHRLNREAKNFTDQLLGAANGDRMRALLGASRENGVGSNQPPTETTARRAAKLNCKARTLDGFFWMVQRTATAKSLVSDCAAGMVPKPENFSKSMEPLRQT